MTSIVLEQPFASETQPLDGIHEWQETVCAHKLELENIEEKMAVIKDRIYLEVEMEYELGKEDPLKDVKYLSNEKKRGIEVKKRCDLNSEYSQLKKGLPQMKLVIMLEEAKLFALRRQFIRDHCQHDLSI